MEIGKGERRKGNPFGKGMDWKKLRIEVSKLQKVEFAI
jgi:hypothetical protein